MIAEQEWRVCAHCWDWIWPAERVYRDEQGREPICAVCNVQAVREREGPPVSHGG